MMTTLPSGEDDLGLRRRAAQGDELAFEALIGPLADPAFRLALTMLRDRGEAEDAVQEATLRAWRKIHQARDDRPLRAWFLAITANHCRSVLRGGWRSRVRLGTPERVHAGADERAISGHDLARGLARLSTDERAAIYLFFYLGLPLEEVASVLDLSVSAARSRVYRAARRLRPALELDEVVR